ncbi:hypothetical protein HC891_26925 [Candidatus Gracilibacteria bacterium]|nr:hypothetical protein [Candidatus Gracilibacteria bacterium]
MLGHYGQGPGPASLQIIGRALPSAAAGVCKRLVPRPARAAQLLREGARCGSARLHRAEVRPLWRNLARHRPRRFCAGDRDHRRCARGRWPNVDILVEGHNRFSPHTALQFADAMASYQPTWFETPVPPQRISQMVEVAKRSPVPVACGEDYYSAQQFAELLSHDAVHIIQLEPQYLGMTVSKQVCGMVNAHNGVTAPHSAQGPLCSLVCAHLNTATPNFFIHEIFDDFNDDWSRNILTKPINVENGYIELSDEYPGWGADLNYDEIAKHPYNPNNYLPLFRAGWERRVAVTEGRF